MTAPKAASGKTEVVKAFKGFSPDLTCRGFQFVEGETFEETAAAVLCKRGFHAVTSPLDVFNCYPPGTSIYHAVELEDVAAKRDGDSKVAGRRIRVGASVSLAGLASAHVEFVHENVKKDVKKSAHRAEDRSAASNTGYQSAASNTGDQSAASNTGYQSAASNTGDRSAASNTGYRSAASVSGEDSVAIVTGKDSKAAGALGCWIVLTERDASWHIVEVRAVKVDGKKVEADVFYTLTGGKVVKA